MSKGTKDPSAPPPAAAIEPDPSAPPPAAADDDVNLPPHARAGDKSAVRMKDSMCGTDFSYSAGEVVKVPAFIAQAWISAGIAEKE